MTDKLIQRKYMQIQILKQQLNGLAEEKNMLDEKIAEVNMTIDSLRKLENVAKGEEIWSTVGSGAFVRSDIKDIDTVLISIGAGVVIREDRKKALKILEKRLEDLNNLENEFISEMNKYIEQINKAEIEIQDMATKKMQEEGKSVN